MISFSANIWTNELACLSSHNDECLFWTAAGMTTRSSCSIPPSVSFPGGGDLDPSGKKKRIYNFYDYLPLLLSHSSYMEGVPREGSSQNWPSFRFWPLLMMVMVVDAMCIIEN